MVVDGEERIAGIHSTKSGVCGSGGNDMRVDAYLQWLSNAASGDLLLPGGNPSSPPPGDCHGSTPSFDWSYCSRSCRCDEGQGDCDSDSECADGLVCRPDIGASYGQSASLDICVKPDPPTGPREGESCATTACAANLTCISVYSAEGGSLGRFCMEPCNSPGGNDPICESGETCTRARTGATVCFNPGASGQGYTTP